MKRSTLFITLALILFPTFYTSAQITTKFGDNVASLNGIIKAYYDVVTVKKGGKVSYERDSLIHWPGVFVGAVSVGRDGKSRMQYFSLKQYHRMSDAGLERNGFDEREISRKVEKFGSIYHVWSTYE